MSTGSNNPENSGSSAKPQWWEVLAQGAMKTITGSLGFMFFAAIFVGLLMFIPGVREFIQEKFPDIAAGIDSMLTGMGMPSLFPAALENYFTNAPLDDLRKQLASKLGDGGDDVAQVLTADETTRKGFVALVKNANGGKFDEKTITSANTIYALMTQQPPTLAMNIVNAIKPGGKAGGMTAQLTTAIKTIVADPAKFNALFSANSFDVTVAALAKLNPGTTTVTPEALGQFIRTVGMKDGVPTKEFYDFASKTLAGDQTAFTGYILRPEVIGNPAAISALMQGVTVAPAPELGDNPTPEEKSTYATAQNMSSLVAILKKPENAGKLSQLLTDLGPDNAQQFIQLATGAGSNPDAAAQLQNFALLNQVPFKKFAEVDLTDVPPSDLVDSITTFHKTPPHELEVAATFAKAGVNPVKLKDIFPTETGADGKSQIKIPELMDNLLSPDKGTANRALLRDAVSKLSDMSPADAQNVLSTIPGLSLQNAQSLLKFVNKLAEANQDADDKTHNNDRAQALMGVVAQVLLVPSHDFSLLAKMDPNEVATFFGNDANKRAFYSLLIDMDNNNALSKQDRAIVSVLRHSWMKADGSGVAPLLANPTGVKLLQMLIPPGSIKDLAKMDAQALATFFANDDNKRSVYDLLCAADDNKDLPLSDQDRQLLHALRENWLKADKTGIAYAMAKVEGVKFIQQQLTANGQLITSGDIALTVATPAPFQIPLIQGLALIKGAQSLHLWEGLTNPAVRDNAASLQAMNDAMKGVTHDNTKIDAGQHVTPTNLGGIGKGTNGGHPIAPQHTANVGRGVAPAPK